MLINPHRLAASSDDCGEAVISKRDQSDQPLVIIDADHHGTIGLPRSKSDLGAHPRCLEMQYRDRRQPVTAVCHLPSDHLARLPWAMARRLALPDDPEVSSQRERFDVRTLCPVHKLVDVLVD